MLKSNTLLIDEIGEDKTPFLFLNNSENIAGTEVFQDQIQLLYGNNVKVVVMQGYSEVVEIRDISLKQSKIEIEKYIKQKGKAFYSDISKALKLDIELVVNACNELEDEKIIMGT